MYVIVTRHQGLVQYLDQVYNIKGEVVAHATPAQIEGRHVIGNLPLHLAVLAKSVTEIPLELPLELRGKELTCEQISAYAKPLVTYKVMLAPFPFSSFDSPPPVEEGDEEIVQCF